MLLFKKKQNQNFWVYGIGGGVMEAIYCFFIAVLFRLMDNLISGPPSAFTLLLFLLIFVFSAAVSGLLIFGYPVFLITKKKYEEAIFTSLLSISTLIVISLCIVFIKVIF